MNEDESLEAIRRAIAKVNTGAAEKIDRDSDLVADGILDSLDVMSFLFELEEENGKIETIDESYTDFRVESLVQLLRRQ